MSTPIRIFLDPRYSDPTATGTPWEETVSALQQAQISWISTVRPDGRPHVTPLVAVWIDGLLYFHTGANEVKYANLLADPRVVLTTGCSTWSGGLDVVVEGEASRLSDSETLQKVAEAFGEKWDGRWKLGASDGGLQSEVDGAQSVVFAVRPVQAYAFAKGDPFGQTAYSFE